MRRFYYVSALLLTMILMGNPAFASIIEGVFSQGNEVPRTPESQPLFRNNFEFFINFDETPQPPEFALTIALSDEYLGLGVAFSGPNPGDGGGILDEAGNFGVGGYSPPNFLAFNCNSEFADGHLPIGPERLDFIVPVTVVSALVGSSSGEMSNLTLDAYDADGALVASSSLILTNGMQELSVEAAAISYVVFGQDAPCVWILDDLGFNRVPVANEMDTWSRVKVHYR